MFRLALIFTFSMALGNVAFATSDIKPEQYGLSGHKYGVLYCRNSGGGRKVVWINTDKGTYALNGPAISWVQKTNAQGTPLVGSDGNPIKLGRHHLALKTVQKLINAGLKECD